MTARIFLTHLRLSVLAITTIAFLSACATTTPQGPAYPRTQDQPYSNGSTDIDRPQDRPDEPDTPEDTDTDLAQNGLTPAFMDGKSIKRIALILPFSARSKRLREEAASMLKSAEMALFDANDDDLLLIALDSAGTPQGAALSAHQARDQGADIILGPILATSVTAASEAVQESGIPVIAFSTDSAVSGGNVFLLSFPPEAEVKRITQFAASSGAQSFAFLGPNSNYGRRVLSAYKDEITNLGARLNGVESYRGKTIDSMQDPAEKLSKLYVDALDENDPKHVAFQAVLLPEGGTALRSLAPLLTYFDDSLRNVQFMGTGLWHKDEVVKEPALNGGIFAGPDLDARKNFNASYDAKYAQEPSRLASLAYDGVNIGAYIAGSPREQRYELLTDPAGFFGVDGLVQFKEDGTTRRGLAVYQIRNGRFVIIDPAPKTSDGAF